MLLISFISLFILISFITKNVQTVRLQKQEIFHPTIYAFHNVLSAVYRESTKILQDVFMMDLE